MTVKVSQNLNLMQKNVINIVKPTTYLVRVVKERWSKTVENKSITKNHQIQNKQIEYRTLELNYRNTQLSNV